MRPLLCALIFLIGGTACHALQQPANTVASSTGACSPNILSNQGKVEFTCNTAKDIDKATVAKIVDLLNLILKDVKNQKLDQMLDISTVRSQETSLIYRLRKRVDTYYSEDAYWRQSNPELHPNGEHPMRITVLQQFRDEYEADYRREVNEVHDKLLGGVRHLPPQNMERLSAFKPMLPGVPILPLEIEAQMSDLRMLLNEMEKENGLPLSCTDVALRSIASD